ncbi:MAG: hypothetical protein ACHREM_00335 [Polyangiales bacterium]
MGLFERLIGTMSSYFQIGGPSGPRWKNNGGNIDARASDDSAYVNVRGLDPVAANDLVTLEYLQANVPTKGAAVIDFGATPTDTASVVVTGQANIVAGSKITVSIAYADSVDHSADEHLVEPLRVIAGTIVPGTGFTIYGICDLFPTYGKFNVNWTWV